jgi:hypothetical protein
MKRTFLRKRSPRPERACKDRADRALQDAYRREYPKEKCEVCGAQFDIMHHHVEKSNSMFLRWMQPVNLIFLCSECHQKIHFGNSDPVSAYSIKRGDVWLEHIRQARKDPSPVRLKKDGTKLRVYYGDICVEDYYKNNIPVKY